MRPPPTNHPNLTRWAGKSRLKVALAAAASALLTILGTAAPCAAQDQVFYYNGLTEQENADVIAWSVLFWQRADQGGGSPGTGFTFDNPVMNSHLFNPVRSARPTLEAINEDRAAICDQMYTVPFIGGNASEEYRLEIKNLMLFGEITTDPEEDPWGNWEHLMLILSAPEDTWLQVLEANGEITSINLPLEEVSGAAYEAALKLELSTQSQQILGTLISAGGYWASTGQSGDVPQWQSLITGEQSKAERFRGLVDQYLWLCDAPDVTTELIQTTFGVFGELPVVLVQLSDAYILIDPTTGNLSGPFETSSPLDARGLLQAHSEYEAGVGTRIYSASGCTIAGLMPPPNTNPYPRPPVFPWVPQPPIAPGTTPGNPTTWECGDVTGPSLASCCCTRNMIYIDPRVTPPTQQTVQQRCCLPGLCGGTVAPTKPKPGSNCEYYY